MPSTQQYDVGATAPVILPLRANTATETRQPYPADGLWHFAFPELAATAVESSGDAPMARWPNVDSPKVAQATAAVAETIYRRLQPNHPSILALTSPGDGDGKTSTTIALASELAKRTGSMLVVDADYRKGDLSTRISVSNRPTGSDKSMLIYPTDQSGLHVLPYNDAAPKYWNRDWFEDLRDCWPLVVFDAPSLEHPEAAPIMRYCDGVYLIIRSGHTARRAVAQAARAIAARGSRLLGSVVIG